MSYIIRTHDRLKFKDCRQAWDLGSKIRQNYEPLRESVHLWFGTCVHAGAEAYYEPLTWGHRTVQEANALTAFTEAMEGYKPDHNSTELMAEWGDRYDLGIGMLNNYFDWAPKHDEGGKPIKVEVEFEVPISAPYEKRLDLPQNFGGSVVSIAESRAELYHRGKPVYYQGRVDLLWEDKYGCLWIVDHKTAGKWDNTDHLDMDEQTGCVPYDTEALTQTGWKVRSDLCVGDLILAYDRERNVLDWTPIRAISDYKDAEIGEFGNTVGSFKAITTPNHRWVGQRLISNGKYAKTVQWESTSDKFPTAHGTLFTSGVYESKVDDTLDISPVEAAFIAWVLTDGSIVVRGHTYHQCAVSQALHKFSDEIDELVHELNLKHSWAIQDSIAGNPYKLWQFSSPQIRALWERAELWEKTGLERFVLRLTPEARDAFTTAGMMAEGCGNIFCQNDGEVKEAFRLAFFLQGYCPSRGTNKKFTLNKPVKDSRTLKYNPTGRADVWCPTTDYGTWVMRQGSQITITGNSYCWALQKQLGIKVEGVIYNELLKVLPEYPKQLKSGKFSLDKSQNTTVELYREALDMAGQSEVGYEEFLVWLQDNERQYFRRTTVHRSQRELEILGERIGLEAIDMLNDPSIYPSPNRFKCGNCEFRTPCLMLMDGSDVDYLLQTNFRKRS